MKDGMRVTFKNWLGEQVTGTAYLQRVGGRYPLTGLGRVTVQADEGDEPQQRGILYHSIPESEITILSDPEEES